MAFFPSPACLSSLGSLSGACKKFTTQTQFPCPGSRPLGRVHNIYVYSRFFSILAAILCYASVASLLHFIGSTSEGPSGLSSPLATPVLMQEQSISPFEQRPSKSGLSEDESCDAKRVYIHSLPPMFNQDIVSDCNSNSRKWIDVCSAAANGGLGHILENEEGVLTQPHDGLHSWYATEQFILDVLFHTRMKKYRCLAKNSAEADLIYVPFYAGLDSTRNLWDANLSLRDHLPNSLADWLTKQPEWNAMQGVDHFLVTGKSSWDFRRITNDESGWGNNLLELPALKDVSVLLIEKGPSSASDVEHAIPYPTFFHPRTDLELFRWQDSMRSKERTNLFAFANADRPTQQSISAELMKQCQSAKSCKLLECSKERTGCKSPIAALKLFQESIFCLQPAGDMYTRRSVFDSMVCGCIPVLFHAHTVYTQYDWHLPHNFSAYSVFIPEPYIRAKRPIIEGFLQRIPSSQVTEMRENVISLIPSLIYGHPDNHFERVKDAFDLTVEGLLRKVRAAKKSANIG